MLVNRQSWDDLRKDVVWIQIWVMTVAAITGPPAVVDGKLRQVSEPMPNQSGVNSGGSAPPSGCETDLDLREPLRGPSDRHSRTGDE